MQLQVRPSLEGDPKNGRATPKTVETQHRVSEPYELVPAADEYIVYQIFI